MNDSESNDSAQAGTPSVGDADTPQWPAKRGPGRPRKDAPPFRRPAARRPEPMPKVKGDPLTTRQREILEYIQDTSNERGFPPSVREIGTAVGLTSPSTVHSHLRALQRLGYLRRDSSKPRAIVVDTAGNADVNERRPIKHVPLLGDVAAGTGVLAHEHVEEVLPIPADLTGDGDLFMLRVRGDSMIEAGIFSGDLIVARSQPDANEGEIVIAGIPGEEATVKTLHKLPDAIELVPANSTMQRMRFEPGEVTIYGRVVTVLRKL